jgi:hypothetical protein
VGDARDAVWPLSGQNCAKRHAQIGGNRGRDAGRAVFDRKNFVRRDVFRQAQRFENGAHDRAVRV